MHLAAAVHTGCVREYMCDGAQHAWLHACVQWHDAVSAGGAHHHKVPLLHHLHCVFKEFGSLTCDDFFLEALQMWCSAHAQAIFDPLNRTLLVHDLSCWSYMQGMRNKSCLG